MLTNFIRQKIAIHPSIKTSLYVLSGGISIITFNKMAQLYRQSVQERMSIINQQSISPTKPLTLSHSLPQSTVRDDQSRAATLDEKESAPDSTNLSLPFYLLNGAIAGLCGALAGAPFLVLKARLQSGQIKGMHDLRFALQPKEILRGAKPFTLSLTGTSTVQIVLYHLFRHKYQDTPYQDHLAAISSGAVSALFSNTAGMLTLFQQLTLKPMSGAAYYIASGGGKAFSLQHLLYFRYGLLTIGIREFGFGYAMLAGAKTVDKKAKESLQHYFPITFSGEKGNEQQLQFYGLLAQLIFGVGASLATHPFDTLSTLSYKGLHHQLTHGHKVTPQWRLYLDISSQLYKQRGIAAFYPGATARIMLFITCMLVIGNTSRKLNTLGENLFSQRESNTTLSGNMNSLWHHHQKDDQEPSLENPFPNISPDSEPPLSLF